MAKDTPVIDQRSDKSRYCDTCGTWGPVWAVWHRDRMDFKWQCSDCRTDLARRYHR